FVISSSIQAYLYKMTQNRCLNFIKHKKVENAYISYLIRNNLLDDYHQSWNPYLTKELEDQAKKAIEKLPEKCKEVFKLSRFEHLKNKEIAQRLNISQKTVERQMTIALERLRKYLKHSIYSLFF
ncbi:MAG TPA: sigma-70 family RNA polymerase sigma factor, partial [Sphingobacteriaceae bacterium]